MQSAPASLLDSRRPRWRALTMPAIALLFFAAIAPCIAWPQFSNDSEDLVVQTVLEMRHGGPLWVPMLGGEPRIRKPPLPTWLSAAAVPRRTLQELDSANPAVREAAYRRLAFDVRWPALAAMCLMLAVIGYWGQLAGGFRLGVTAALVAGSTLFFLRMCRIVTTDAYLALFVCSANCLLTLAILRRKWWIGLVGAGAALGLAMMSKGPVALLQSPIPFLVYLWARRRSARRSPAMIDESSAAHSVESNRPGATPRPPRPWLAPLLIGIAVLVALCAPWYISAARTPDAGRVWKSELEGEHFNDPLSGFLVTPLFLSPWLVPLAIGCFIAAKRRRMTRPLGLMLVLVIVPTAVMICFPLRKDRYLLPMLGPMAIIMARGALRMVRLRASRMPLARWLNGIHWAVLALMVVWLPIAGAFVLREADGRFWYSRGEATALLLALGLAVGAGAWARERWKWSVIASGVGVLLLFNAAFLQAWSRCPDGLSEMKPIADAIHNCLPPGEVCYYDPPRRAGAPGKPVTLDLDIYLSRIVQLIHNPADVPARGVVAIVALGSADAATLQSRHFIPFFDRLNTRFHPPHHWFVFMPPPHQGS
jgi:4-amino-4-deoxy-L-arabinose transferase-like glycosyltransferase